MLYLDKILAHLAYPLCFSLVLLLIALVLLLLRLQWSGLGLLFFSLCWLYVWSMPAVSDQLRLSLESQSRLVDVEKLPQAGAIVLLGGGLSTGPPSWPYPDLGAAGDRIWHAARLYDADKAPFILISGGTMPWNGQRFSVAEATASLLTDLGVPDSAIRIEGQSLNTRQNAVYSAEVLQKQDIDRVLLVTSALHMPRAMGCFEAVGLEVQPAPIDFEVKPEPNHFLRWLPDAEALADATRAFKEYLGLLVYWLRGWV